MFVKKILYTVCSANHLAHCKTMADSFALHNPGYTIVIALADEIAGRFSVDAFAPYTILETGKIGISGFDEMAARYTVIELNCAMKAFVAQHILDTFHPDILLYLDADILVLHSFDLVEQEMLNHDLLITPHITKPYPDQELLPRERDTLRSGVYNAGFLAMKPGAVTTAFLQWWAQHMRTECYYNFSEGMGVDQVWINLVPLLFKTTGIFTHAGANVAYWNLHERTITAEEGVYKVNGTEPLLFLHISGYSFEKPTVLSRHQNRYELHQFPVLQELLDRYRNAVISNGYEIFIQLECVYARKKKKSTGLMKSVNQLLRPLGVKIADI
jgi:hypothetical protein